MTKFNNTTYKSFSYHIAIIIVFCLSLSIQAFGQFTTTWKTDNTGPSNDDQITIPTAGAGYNYDVYWEEVGNPTNFGTEPLGQTGNHTITFPSAGTYQVEITGSFPRIYFNGGGDRLKILTVEFWGDNPWTSMANAFLDCTNLTVTPFDAPDLSGVTDLTSMFQGAITFDNSINNWDVSTITIMQNMFFGCDLFNQDLTNWDVGNVTNMGNMFGHTDNFNGDITNWDVTSVTDFSFMFSNALVFNQNLNNWLINTTPGAGVNMRAMFQFTNAFNQDLNNWQMDEVVDTRSMFRNSQLFNGNIENWNVSKVTQMSGMFLNSQVFNRDLNGWDVSAVTTMQSMFDGAIAYTRDLTGWNTRLGMVLDMDMLFHGATSFNGDVSGWDVGNVQTMQGMFGDASVFNQSLASWDVDMVSDMRNMFLNASNFNQSLASWNIQLVTAMDNMLSNSNMSTPNYDATLIGWESSGLAPPGVNLDAVGVNYCTAGAAIAGLTALGWTIIDAGLLCSTTPNSPSNLFTSEISSLQIDLSWVDNSSDETGFTIERTGGGNQNFTSIATVGSDITTFSDNTVSPETGYYYRVIANGNTNDSGPSNEKFGSTITPAGHALALDGDDDVQISDHPDLQFGTGDFTIEAWIYYDGTDKAAAIIGKRNPSPPFEQIQLRMGTGLNQPAGKQVEAYIMPDTRAFGPVESPEDRIATDPADLTIGWHHIAMVEDYDTDLRVYVDGVQVAIDTDDHLGKPMNAVGQDLFIGSFGVGEHFVGLIDDVRIWNTARTPAEVLNNMNTTFIGNEVNLIAYYRFDQGIPNTDNTTPPVNRLPDRSTNTHDGTLINTALIGSVSNWVKSAATPRPFITTWQTDIPASTNDDQIRIPAFGAGYNYDIYWEEVGSPINNGTEPPGQTGTYEITFPSPGTYRVEISGDFPRIYFNNTGDNEKIISVDQWGTISWSSFAAAFDGCENLQVNAVDAPDLSGVTSLADMFHGAEIMNADLRSWDVSTITDMSSMFYDAYAFNQPLNTWDVSNVISMRRMFYFAREFNQDVKNWDISNVNDVSSMFGGATVFNQDIGIWDISNVTSIYSMFTSAATFNQDISSWDISGASSLAGMFSGASSFNQDISGWNTTGVTSLSFMFSGASDFNQDITGWDISLVTNMGGLFRDATSFNQDISGWDVSIVTEMDEMFSGTNAFTADITGWNVSNVSNMRSMFEDNTTFNQDISGWNVSKVYDMNGMFERASAFNQPIGTWSTTLLNDTRNMFTWATSFDQNLGGLDLNTANLMVNMLSYSGMSVANYDLTLIGWEGQVLQNNVNFDARGVFYCSASSERANIIANFGWTIDDGGAACINVFEGATVAAPQIADGQINPVDVGSAAFGGTRLKTITIENNLAVDLTALSIIVTTVTGSAFTPLAVPGTILTGTTISVDIELGGAIGVFSEMVSITAAEFTDPFEFPISGEVTASNEPEIAVYRGSVHPNNVLIDGQLTSYSFGSEERGSDIIRSIYIENKGSDPLNISAITFTNPVFYISEVFPIIIPVDGTYEVVIVLDGTVALSYFEQITIVSNDSDEDMFEFPVSGTIEGPEIVAFDGPNRYAYPEVDNGQVNPIDLGSGTVGPNLVKQITLANFGPVHLDISNITITGTAFSINATPPLGFFGEYDGVIDSQVFDITLTGASAGLFSETVTITSDDDSDPIFTFDLVGTIEGPSPPPHIYWTEDIGDGFGGDDEIHRTDLDGDEFHRYYQGFSAEIAGLEMDTANNRLYWTDAARAEIIYGEIGPNGLSSGPTVILDFNPGGTNDLEDLALDEPNGHIYFTHGNAETGFDNKIARVDIDGSNYMELINLGFEEPFGIDLDLANGKMYYTTNLTGTDQDGRLYRANLDGSLPEQLFYLSTPIFAGNFMRDVKIDPVNEVVYWSGGEEDLPGGQIYYNSINEAAPFASPSTFSFPGEPRGIDIDLYNDKLYWVCRGANSGATRPMLMRSNLDGTTIENIFTVALYPEDYPTYPPGSAHLALDLRGLGVGVCINSPTADAGIDQIICDVGVATLNATLGGGASTVSWTTPGDGSFDDNTSLTAIYTPGANDISAGSITLTITTDDPDGSGPCLAATEDIIITINPAPTVVAGADQIICEADAAILNSTIGGSAATVTWATPGDGTFNDNTSLTATYTPGANDIAAGTITLTIATDDPDGVGLCIAATDDILITIENTPIVNAGADQSVCAVDVVTLGGVLGGSATSATWTTNGDGIFDDASLLAANYTPGSSDISNGTTTLTLTSIAGVSCSSMSDDILISISLPIAVVDQSASLDAASTVSIDVRAGGTFNISDNLTTTILSQPIKGSATVSTAGSIDYTSMSSTVGDDSFDFEVCNQCGQCSTGITNITINNVPPTVNIPPSAIESGGILTLNVLDNLIDDNGNVDLSSLSIIIQPLSGALATLDASGVLTVDYSGVKFAGTDELTIEICDFLGSCTQTIITIEVAPPGVVVFNAVSPNGDGKHDFLEIEGAEFYPNNQIKIMNRWGEIIYEAQSYDNLNTIFTGINKGGGELPSGTYYYLLSLGDGSNDINGFFSLRR